MDQEIADKLAAIPERSSVGFSHELPMDGSSFSDILYAQDHMSAKVSYRPSAASNSSRLGSFPRSARTSSQAATSPGTTPTDAPRGHHLRDLCTRVLARCPEDALGKKIRVASTDDWREIVGVAQNIHDDGVDQKPPSHRLLARDASQLRRTNDRPAARSHFLIRGPRAGSSGLHERGPTAGLADQPQRAAGRGGHHRRALHQIHGAHFLHAGPALRSGRHGSAARASWASTA